MLNFLRDGGCELPEASVDRRELLREADYYQARLALQAVKAPRTVHMALLSPSSKGRGVVPAKPSPAD